MLTDEEKSAIFTATVMDALLDGVCESPEHLLEIVKMRYNARIATEEQNGGQA